MTRFGRIQALWKSFYSRDLYRACARSWKGLGVLYLLLLLALSWLPSAWRTFNAMRDFAATDGRAIVDRLPIVRIAQGEMSAEPQGRHVIPLVLENENQEGMVLIIDDTIDRVPSNETGAALVLLDYRSLVRLSALAVTPAIVVRTLLWFGPWEPAWYLRWPVAIAISLAYLVFAIRAAVAEDTVQAPAVPEG